MTCVTVGAELSVDKGSGVTDQMVRCTEIPYKHGYVKKGISLHYNVYMRNTGFIL